MTLVGHIAITRSIDPAEVERLDYLSDRGGLIYKAEEVRSRGIEPILADIAAKWGGGSGGLCVSNWFLFCLMASKPVCSVYVSLQSAPTVDLGR